MWSDLSNTIRFRVWVFCVRYFSVYFLILYISSTSSYCDKSCFWIWLCIWLLVGIKCIILNKIYTTYLCIKEHCEIVDIFYLASLIWLTLYKSLTRSWGIWTAIFILLVTFRSLSWLPCFNFLLRHCLICVALWYIYALNMYYICFYQFYQLQWLQHFYALMKNPMRFKLYWSL